MTDTVLFPSDPLNERAVDPEFQSEWDRLYYTDIKLALIDQDALANNGETWFRRLPENGNVLYRGWMLSLDAYAIMYSALRDRNLWPVTTPLDYWRAHHINAWYGAFHAITPRTNWVKPGSDDDRIKAAAALTQGTSFVIKDYVKSRKHEWDTAVFAPTVDALPAIVREFERLQEDTLVGNVVIRDFIQLDKSLPEYRIWWSGNGDTYIVSIHPDFDATAFNPGDLDTTWIESTLRPLVRERAQAFITTDIAIRTDGTPVLIEVGDGQVSGLPRDRFDTHGEDVYAAVIAGAFTNANR